MSAERPEMPEGPEGPETAERPYEQWTRAELVARLRYLDRLALVFPDLACPGLEALEKYRALMGRTCKEDCLRAVRAFGV
jgi:hypothetical protein